MSKDVPVSQQLNMAADLLQQRGWTAGDGWLGDTTTGGKLCLEGAIQAAGGIRPWRFGETTNISREINLCAAGLAVRSYLASEIHVEDPLYTWNDQNERTAEDVIAVLRAAAHIESLKESLHHA